MSKLYLNPISIKNAEKILDQMKSCICIIGRNEEEKGIGIICKMPCPEKNDYFTFLIVYNNLLSSSDINKDIILKLIFNNEENNLSINIDDKREIFESKKYGITFIDIKDLDNKIKTNFELDEKIKEEDSYYNNKQIYLFNSGEDNNIFVSFGKIINFKENTFDINYYKNKKNSILPILSLDTFKLMGFINCEINKTIFINDP